MFPEKYTFLHTDHFASVGFGYGLYYIGCFNRILAFLLLIRLVSLDKVTFLEFHLKWWIYLRNNGITVKYFLSGIFLSYYKGQWSLICLKTGEISLIGKNWLAYLFSQKVLVISCRRKEVEENPPWTLPDFLFYFLYPEEKLILFSFPSLSLPLLYSIPVHPQTGVSLPWFLLCISFIS